MVVAADVERHPCIRHQRQQTLHQQRRRPVLADAVDRKVAHLRRTPPRGWAGAALPAWAAPPGGSGAAVSVARATMIQSAVLEFRVFSSQDHCSSSTGGCSSSSLKAASHSPGMPPAAWKGGRRREATAPRRRQGGGRRASGRRAPVSVMVSIITNWTVCMDIGMTYLSADIRRPRTAADRAAGGGGRDAGGARRGRRGRTGSRSTAKGKSTSAGWRTSQPRLREARSASGDAGRGSQRDTGGGSGGRLRALQPRLRRCPPSRGCRPPHTTAETPGCRTARTHPTWAINGASSAE